MLEIAGDQCGAAEFGNLEEFAVGFVGEREINEER